MEDEKMNVSTKIERAELRRRIRRKKQRQFFRAMFSRKITIVAAVLLLLIILIAVLAPVVSPYDPNEAVFRDALQQPSLKHLLGTDNFGRDVLSRLIYGARISLMVGVFAVLIATCIGTFLGMIAAYFGGWVDTVIMRISEAIISIPYTILAMALIAVLGGGFVNMFIILGIIPIPGYIRMMRGRVLSVRKADYVVAAKLQGNRSIAVMVKHILPNSFSSMLVLMTQQVGVTILVEAGLSFLGIGISIPTASWGSMVNDGKAYLLSNPVLGLVPGLCVAILVICINIVGDGIRDAMDPRLRGEI